MLRLALTLSTLLYALALAAVGVWFARASEPAEGLAEGVTIAGARPLAGQSARELAEDQAQRLLARSVLVRRGGDVVAMVSAADLGARVDVDAAVARAEAVGRRGSRVERLRAGRAAREHGVDVPLRVRLPIEPLAARFADDKERTDRRPEPARIDLETGTITPHQPGAMLDLYAAAESFRPEGAGFTLDLEPDPIEPLASTEALRAAALDAVLATFETRYGGPVGRNRNVERAATALDGILLMPGDEVSFNDVVGPRTRDNGFFEAPEIYRGEMREGIGGGSCQVASTIYAAAFFAGLEVLDRRNHSRPSGYIRPGLDATVSYPVLDLRIRNDFEFPVVLGLKAKAGVLRAELRGAQKPLAIALATETVGVSKYRRKIERTAMLPSGEFRLKQRGKNGMSIRRIRTVRPQAGGAERVEISTDVYPPTQEIYLVGPGTDAESVLPPLGGEPNDGDPYAEST